ncbi:hypothetical protein SACS_1193 [Parasaccharibacter apium]|uniref:Uncharacterized protein n=1 Tax=Parasaccharibacter apium TaxID=1510841 RepID=A0A7U7J1A5_9PROT|nr:hypothetical protein [Parasaccharibacter apium]CDG33931.1 hypothetical protein SACS_1193 [Parasaccharibacter apium]
MMGRYRDFENNIRKKMEEEKKHHAENGADKEYFVYFISVMASVYYVWRP